MKGKTRLQVLLDIEKQTGVVAPELKALPEIPAGTEHVWDWFCDLSGARQCAMDAQPIQWSDMRSYFDLMRLQPHQWEVRAIRALDDRYLAMRAAEAVVKAGNAAALAGAVGARKED